MPFGPWPGSSGGGGSGIPAVDLTLSYGHGVEGVDDQIALSDEGGGTFWLSPTTIADIATALQVREYPVAGPVTHLGLLVEIDTAVLLNEVNLEVTANGGNSLASPIVITIPAGTSSNLLLTAQADVVLPVGSVVGVKVTGGPDADGDVLRLEATLVSATITEAPLPPSDGLVLWLEADYGVTYNPGGGSPYIQAWLDRSGNNQGATNFFGRVTLEPGAINGHTAAVNPDVNTSLDGPAPAGIVASGAPRYLLVVLQQDAAPAGAQIVFCFRTTDTKMEYAFAPTGGDIIITGTSPATASAKVTAPSDTGVHLVEWGSVAGSLPLFVIDGTSYTAVANVGDGKAVAETGTTSYAFMNGGSAFGSGFVGKIAAVLGYNTLTPPAGARAYLKAKYGTP